MQGTRYFLFFDTETTGLPRNYKAPSSELSNWPRLVQFSWIITNEGGQVIRTRDFIIYPDGFTIPAASSDVHGITTEIARQKGADLLQVLNTFIQDFNQVDYIVGHNISFDKKVVGAELIRSGMRDVMDSKPTICTMLSTVDYCQIPGYYGYKWPKLQELHEKLFGRKFDDAHNSAADIEATKNCFWELVRRGIIRI